MHNHYSHKRPNSESIGQDNLWVSGFFLVYYVLYSIIGAMW